MTVDVIVPQFGMGMAEGTLVQWLAADGSEVTEGSALYELETEKSTQEVEAPASGRLRILKEPNQVYEVGTVLAIIE
ncbi:MAG: dihydrolipoamide acyltransferase [Rhodospirillales bacterium 69-11]|nr:MAG: dihydrolipoamide acyltransferase [Rhodospirillales bacterium 69-11]